MDRIGLLVELLGDKKAIGSLEQLLKLKRELQNKNIEMRMDKLGLDRQINNIKRSLYDLKRYLKNLDVGVDDKKIKETTAEIQRLEDELQRLQRLAKNFNIDIGMNNQGVTAVNQTISDMQRLERQAISLRDVLSGAGQWFSSIGSGLQSIGGLFNTDILSYITQTLTQMGTQAVVGNLDKAATRWDTLSTYAPYMEAVGISADRAKASLDEVDQVIQGLPIGLDEAALDIRRTSMLLNGDLETATKFVEGFDQALIAGGAPQQMRNWSYIEMQRLLTSGKLNQSRQWMSLVQGLGVAVPYLKNAMGYGDLSQAEFEANLFAGSYTGEEVIKGFANMADDEELQKLITIYKGTIESGMSNLHYAMARGLQKTFDAFNEVTLSTTGMGISDYLMSGRDFIDRAFEGIADWVRKNPDTITSILDQVEGLAKRAEKFDWGKLAHSVIGSLESIVDIATWVYDHIPEPVLNGFLTFSLVWATPLGKGFSALGNLFTTLAYLPFPQIGKLTRGMTNMGRFVGSLKTVGQGFLGASAYIGIIAEIGLVIYEMTKVAEVVSKADLDGFWKNFGKIAGFGGILTGLGTALTAIFSAISAIPGGALVVGAGELLSAGFVGLIAEIGAVIYEFTKVAEEIATAKLPNANKITQVFGVIQSIATGITDVNVRLGTRMRTKSISHMIEMLEGIADAIPSLEAITSSNINTSRITDTVTTVLNAYDAIDEAVRQALDGESNISAMLRTSHESDIVSNWTAIIDDLGMTIDTFGGIEDKLNEYGFFNSPNGEENVALTRIRDTLQTIVDMMSEISLEVSDKTSIIGEKRQEIVESIKTDIIKDWEESMQAIADLINVVHTNQDTYSLFSGDDGVEQLKTIKKNAVAVLEQITNKQNNGVLDEVWKAVYKLNNRKNENDWEGLSNIVGYMKSAMENIGLMFDAIRSYSYKLKWVGGGTSGVSFDETITNYNKLVESIAGINLESINGMDTSALAANATNILIAVNRVTGIAQTLQNMAPTLASVNEEGGAVYHLKQMLTSLTRALSGDRATLSAANFTAMAGAIKTLKESLEGITTLDISGSAASVKELGEQVKDLGNYAKTAGGKLEDFKGKIVAVTSVAEVRSSKFDIFNSALQRIANSADDAYDNVYSLMNLLNQLNDKTINITVNTDGLDSALLGLRTLNALTSAASGVRQMASNIANSVLHRANGGKVNYLAKGGTPFKPRGTDTVPAMLTQGEWVINRRASKAFGDNFMRKINNMDIPGAMDALMQRSKWVPSGGIYYTTNNYNNQSVTQNFSRERDSKTSYRRANRYLGAL